MTLEFSQRYTNTLNTRIALITNRHYLYIVTRGRIYIVQHIAFAHIQNSRRREKVASGARDTRRRRNTIQE